jgi:hypothetical protein
MNFARFCLKRSRKHFFSEKHISGSFLQNRPLTNFRGQTDYVARFETKLSRLKTSLAFALNGLEIVFSEKHVFGPFLRNCLSPIFEAKWNMWRVSIQNCLGRKLRSLLPKTAPKSFFQKTRFRSVFTKPPPHLPNGLYGAFRDKIVPNKNFARFCLKRPRNHFFQKTRFRSVFTKPRLIYFGDQTDYVARFDTKLSWTKTSLGFA